MKLHGTHFTNITTPNFYGYQANLGSGAGYVEVVRSYAGDWFVTLLDLECNVMHTGGALPDRVSFPTAMSFARELAINH